MEVYGGGEGYFARKGIVPEEGGTVRYGLTTPSMGKSFNWNALSYSKKFRFGGKRYPTGERNWI